MFTVSGTAFVVGAIASIAVLIDCLEMFQRRSAYSDRGLFDYEVLRTGRRLMLIGPLSKPLLGLFRYPNVLLLGCVQILAALFLIVEAWPGTPKYLPACAVAAGMILVARALLYMRNQLGHDGSDQMLLVVFMGLTVAQGAPDPTGRAIGLYYIAAQSVLSYETSGIAKLAGSKWRTGIAVPQIVNTIGYGYPPLGLWLSSHARTGRTLSWSTIAVECAGPLLLFAGIPWALAFVVMIIGLHASIALVMGLNGFFWSFVACAPALILASHNLHAAL
jgi:hypothetical protein